MTRATLRRILVERTPDWHPRVTGETLSADHVHDGMLAAARYLARNTRATGTSATGSIRHRPSLPDYDWPCHAGATLLAQAAATHDPLPGRQP
jgi:hypothetical protein